MRKIISYRFIFLFSVVTFAQQANWQNLFNNGDNLKGWLHLNGTDEI